jgi:thiol:disulfide interchange protein DsbA
MFVKAEGPGYQTLTPAQPKLNPDKIEVIEFFSYGCPHCYSFEPLLEAWVKKLPGNVEFIRQPVLFQKNWDQYAKAYFVADALHVIDKINSDFFDALHNKNQNLATEEELTKFFVAHGVKEADFRDAFNSFLVDTKMRQAPLMLSRYGVTGVPILIVNGKYKVDGKSAGSHKKMIEVLNQLIKQESSGK